MKTFFIFTLEVFLYHSRVHTISNSIFKDTYLSSPCPPHRFLCSFVSLSTQHFTVHLLPPYGWASSYLTSPILVLSSSSLPYCGAINIFLHCKPSAYTLSNGGVFFLMACPLLDHTRSPWGVPSKKKQSECLFGVIFPVSVLHEDGLKSIAICFEQTRYAFIWIDAELRRWCTLFLTACNIRIAGTHCLFCRKILGGRDLEHVFQW